MKKFSQVVDYYYAELYPIVKELDKKREDVKRKTIAFFAVAAFVLTFGAIYLLKNFAQDNYIKVFIAYVIVMISVFGIIKNLVSSDYVKEFKLKVIEPLIKFIDPKLHYSQEAYIPRHLFERSRIVTSDIDRYGGNDYVQGEIDGVKIEFSDVLAEEKREDSKGNTHYETLFEGMFLHAEFPKHFHSRTVVLPDKAEKVFGSFMGKFLQSHNFSREKLIKMDNPTFEKEFVVYGEDQIESRYILTQSMMERILAFKKKVSHPISLSFIGGELFVAVHYGKDTLEPSVFGSLLDYKIAKEYIETLYYAMGIVEELKLNQKLWSKR